MKRRILIGDPEIHERMASQVGKIERRPEFLTPGGGISLRAMPGGELVQRALLEREGVRLDPRGRVPLARVQWVPRRKTIR